jgi:chorismate dehydratase
LVQKIKVGAVSYLNTKPLIYGFEQGMMADEIELVFNYPAKVADDLLAGDIDLGLVPVAIIPLLTEKYIISDYCIGADGEVATVCLFSDVPINEISTVLLDYQSRTSVALLKILLSKWWKITPQLKEAGVNYEEYIGGNTAGLVIGDRAFEQRRKSKYTYDLGAAWKAYTGLPFVFAAWISNKILPVDFAIHFNSANLSGLQNIDKVIHNSPYSSYDLETYYTKNISYRFDENKEKGLKLFLEMLSPTGL